MWKGGTHPLLEETIVKATLPEHPGHGPASLEGHQSDFRRQIRAIHAHMLVFILQKVRGEVLRPATLWPLEQHRSGVEFLASLTLKPIAIPIALDGSTATVGTSLAYVSWPLSFSSF